MNYIKLLLIVFIVGCSTKLEKANETSINKPDVKQISGSTISDTIKSKPENMFDIGKFKSLADSLISKIADEKILLELIIDTVKNKPNEVSLFKYLQPNNLYIIYRFYPGNKRSMLRFSVSQIIFNDTLSLNNAFSALKIDASGVNFDKEGDERDISPGLTYTNDYVVKTDKQILWLNLPCSYNEKNTKRVSQILRQSFSSNEIKDSVICKCGQSWCKP